MNRIAALAATALVCLANGVRAQTLPRIDPRIAGAEQISVETDSFDNILLDATPTVQEALDWLDDNGGGGGGGASILFDAGDDGVDESAGVTEIATVGDAQGVFTEVSPDKLLINLNLPVPTASALAANGADCTPGLAAAGVSAAGASEGCFDVIVPTEIDTAAEINAIIASGAKLVSTVTADSGGATSGANVTVAGGTGINTVTSGDTVTINSEVVASESGAIHLCDGNTPGGPEDANGRMPWTCANYDHSAEVGGTTVVGSGRVSDWDEPTTPGGNAYTISCTGYGVGIGEDGASLDATADLALGGGTITSGSTTTVIADADVTYGADAANGYVLRMLTGALAGQERYIKDTAANAITLGVALGGTPAAGDTYGIYNYFPTNCYEADTTVRIFAESDFILAQERTQDGGIVYVPEGNYVRAGCGRQTMNPDLSVAAVLNKCPVILGENGKQSGHYQRVVNIGLRGVRWVGPGVDRDRIRADMTGREKAWFVNDMGVGSGQSSAGRYFDPADGRDLSSLSGRSIVIGGSVTQNICQPISATDPRCDVTATDSDGAVNTNAYVLVQDARTFTSGSTVAVHSSDVTDPTAFCVDNRVSSAGVCEYDPDPEGVTRLFPGGRVPCTSAGDNVARTSATAGGCCFDGVCDDGPGDLGRCVGIADMLDIVTDEQRRKPLILLAQGVQIFPGPTYSATQADVGYLPLDSVPGAACGSGSIGKTVSFGAGRWPMVAPRFDTTSSPVFFWLAPEFELNHGGVYGLNFSPNSFYTRDADGDAARDPGDCISESDTDATDDEAGCDSGSAISWGDGANGRFIESLSANGSHQAGGGVGSAFDSAKTVKALIKDSYLVDFRRGAGTDWTDVGMDNVVAENNTVTTMFAINFKHRIRAGASGRYALIMRNNSYLIGVNIGNGVDGSFGPALFEGNVMGQAHITGFDNFVEGFHLHDIECSSLPCVVVKNGTNALSNPVANLLIERIRARSQLFSNGANGPHLSALAFSRGFATDPPRLWRNITARDIQLKDGSGNACAVSFDDMATASKETNRRDGIRLEGVSHDHIDGATGGLSICVSDEATVSGVNDATDDTGIWNEQYLPVMIDVTADGVPMPDQPYPQQAAATCGDCDTAAYAGRICHIHDDTSANACDDTAAGGDGILDGGGSARSICQCQGSTTNWVPFGG